MTMSLCCQGGDEAKYKVELLAAEGAVNVTDGTVSVLVSLTSAVMREPAGEWEGVQLGPAMFDAANFTHTPLYYHS